jgi:histidinol dehydrogenase
MVVQWKICIGSARNPSNILNGTVFAKTAAIKSIGAVSPIARDSDNIIPVRIPGFAFGRT